MDNKMFKLHLEEHAYLMDNTDCYIPNKSGACSCNRWERNLLPECKDCLEHFDKLEGASVPEAVKSTPCWELHPFNTWKTVQMIEVRRLTGEYTEEQAMIVMEEFIKLKTGSCRESNIKQQKSQQVLTQLFG